MDEGVANALARVSVEHHVLAPLLGGQGFMILGVLFLPLAFFIGVLGFGGINRDRDIRGVVFLVGAFCLSQGDCAYWSCDTCIGSAQCRADICWSPSWFRTRS